MFAPADLGTASKTYDPDPTSAGVQYWLQQAKAGVPDSMTYVLNYLRARAGMAPTGGVVPQQVAGGQTVLPSPGYDYAIGHGQPYRDASGWHNPPVGGAGGAVVTPGVGVTTLPGQASPIAQQAVDTARQFANVRAPGSAGIIPPSQPVERTPVSGSPVQDFYRTPIGQQTMADLIKYTIHAGKSRIRERENTSKFGGYRSENLQRAEEARIARRGYGRVD